MRASPDITFAARWSYGRRHSVCGHAQHGMKGFVVLGLLASLAGTADGAFRDDQGNLVLADCAQARAWLPEAGRLVAGDVYAVLDGALACAQGGDAVALKSLLKLADAAPPPDLADEISNGVKRIRILLAVGDVERAEARLLATGATTVAALREQPNDADIATQAFWQTSLNNQAATRLRSTHPRRAIDHQLLAADLHELAGDMGSKDFAVLYHQVALDIARAGGLIDESLRTARQLLALHARYPDLDRSRSASSVAGAALIAAAAGRAAESNALLDELAETGWKEAAGLVDEVRLLIEQKAPSGNQ